MAAMAPASSRSSSSARSSIANSGGDGDSTPRGMRIVFRETERGLSSLRRGWRTPDPSPTRGGRGLPRCAATKCDVDFFPLEKDFAEEAVPPPPEPHWLRQRTPSPDGRHHAYAAVWPEGSELVAVPVPVQPVLCVMPCEQMWPSRGSMGHPYKCNQACKYAKKARGCKDGANCDHCHLCEWKKAKRPQIA